jgi:hypothetical protein
MALGGALAVAGITLSASWANRRKYVVTAPPPHLGLKGLSREALCQVYIGAGEIRSLWRVRRVLQDRLCCFQRRWVGYCHGITRISTRTTHIALLRHNFTTFSASLRRSQTPLKNAPFRVMAHALTGFTFLRFVGLVMTYSGSEIADQTKATTP